MYKKIAGIYFLLFSVYILFSALKLNEIVDEPIGSIHAWRQADCVSVTHHLYKDRSTILNPKTHFAKYDLSSIAGGEFPIVNFIVAETYRITGYQLVNYRIVIYIFYLIGLISIFLIVLDLSYNIIISYLFTMLISLSGILTYYSINFLPDIPSWSLALFSIYLFILFIRKSKNSYLYGSLFFIVLSTLIKITSGMILAGYGFYFCYYYFSNKRNLKFIFFTFLALVPIISWYYYSNYLENKHAPFIFLTGLRPIWNTYHDELKIVFDSLVFKWGIALYSGWFWFFTSVLFFYLLFNLKKIPVFYKISLFSTLALGLLFILLMYRQFIHHDYLLIGLSIIPILCWISFFSIGFKNHFERKSVLLYLILLGLIVTQFISTRKIIHSRYFEFDNLLIINPAMAEMKNQLTLHHIPESSVVLSVPDPSPNITLASIDRKGFTNYKLNPQSGEVKKLICYGVDYLIVSQKSELSKDYIKPFITQFVFSYKDICVFDVRSFKDKCN